MNFKEYVREQLREHKDEVGNEASPWKAIDNISDLTYCLEDLSGVFGKVEAWEVIESTAKIPWQSCTAHEDEVQILLRILWNTYNKL